jgi:hypothetical protein
VLAQPPARASVLEREVPRGVGTNLDEFFMIRRDDAQTARRDEEVAPTRCNTEQRPTPCV